MILIGLLGKVGLATDCVIRLSNEISTKNPLRKNLIWQAYQNYQIQGDFSSKKNQQSTPTLFGYFMELND
ncbi:MAG: hypothetical protein EBY91_08760 [Burkholderiaceae bacterium]|nr:hypothetical protein [Burkholderiaceae bacterium]BEI38709.1 hypothetical protein PHIN8_06530 [Polynucleobacter sp. HIN8]